MASKVLSATTIGLNSHVIEVEADTHSGLHSFNIVGLPDTAVKESRERVDSAIKNSGLKPPHRSGRVTINLAPADIKKEGPMFDLPIALCFLAATKQIRSDIANKLFIGELALDGKIRPVNGVLPIAIMAKEKKLEEIFIPKDNAEEAAIVDNLKIIPVSDLKELVQHLHQEKSIDPQTKVDIKGLFQGKNYTVDMSHIKGQEYAKRALEVAAAGGHNLLLSGPPGSGKTILAKTFPTILPPLTFNEALEVTKIFSIAGNLPAGTPLVRERPFRSPHHSASAVSLVGGGQYPRPGEISLAHRGVLFLDEFPEFSRTVLENLRQPLEDGVICVSRAQGTLSFPARFTLVAAMNPCPCGNASDPEKICSCSASQVAKYQRKISGPILDRIDIFAEVPRLKFEKLNEIKEGEKSESIRLRVAKARERQTERFKELDIVTNSEMQNQHIKRFCSLGEKEIELLRKAVNQLHLSARAFNRIIKIARTIADLENKDKIEINHLAESVQYRQRQI